MQIDPKVVYDGANFVIVWRDRRNYQSLPSNFLPLITDIYAARVSPQGALMDGNAATGGILLESSATAKQAPTLLRTSRGVVLGWPDSTYANTGNAAGIYRSATHLARPAGGQDCELHRTRNDAFACSQLLHEIRNLPSR